MGCAMGIALELASALNVATIKPASATVLTKE